MVICDLKKIRIEDHPQSSQDVCPFFSQTMVAHPRDPVQNVLRECTFLPGMNKSMKEIVCTRHVEEGLKENMLLNISPRKEEFIPVQRKICSKLSPATSRSMSASLLSCESMFLRWGNEGMSGPHKLKRKRNPSKLVVNSKPAASHPPITGQTRLNNFTQIDELDFPLVHLGFPCSFLLSSLLWHLSTPFFFIFLQLFFIFLNQKLNKRVKK